ncbi:hypothetical protein NHX12_021068 [Muraenolepis orangiensis]|uniref:Uncharacterized protein n=1 Tax=Muraenolepis orangiensis TaxID=630683 RepID=A0A9Q0IRY6_9TELE|nr:hypothetical protein NHX12_021068 [Muraenolepis orangiensis]
MVNCKPEHILLVNCKPEHILLVNCKPEHILLVNCKPEHILMVNCKPEHILLVNCKPEHILMVTFPLDVCWRALRLLPTDVVTLEVEELAHLHPRGLEVELVALLHPGAWRWSWWPTSTKGPGGGVGGPPPPRGLEVELVAHLHPTGGPRLLLNGAHVVTTIY